MGMSTLAKSRLGRDAAVSRSTRRVFAGAAVPLLFACLAGCQGAQPIRTYRLIEHQALIDFSGLKPAETMADLKVRAAVPRSWEFMPPAKSPLYTHHQWRSASAKTGIGAAHLRLPLPLSADAILWLAKGEYAKRGTGGGEGRLIRQWTDALGRSCFEAENAKYHVHGYCLAQGFEAWIVYFGYRTNQPPDPAEISLAARCADTFVPLTGKAMRGALDAEGEAANAPATKPSAGQSMR